MLKYISSCYSYVCEIISKRLEYLQSIDKSRLEQENDYYCRITDGGFVIKKVEEPTVLCPPTAGLPPTTPSLIPTSFYLRGTARQTPSQKGGMSEAVST